MKCWSCGGAIPDESRFCGLCGSRQSGDEGDVRETQTFVTWKAEGGQVPPAPSAEAPAPAATLINTPALARPDAQTPTGSGSHRFAALEAVAASEQVAEARDTLSEAGELVRAVRASGEQPALAAHPRSSHDTLFDAAPPGSVVEPDAQPEARSAAEPDAQPDAEPDPEAGAQPDAEAEAQADEHVERDTEASPSVVVDPALSAPPKNEVPAADAEAPAATVDPPRPEQRDNPAFRETNWFMDALDPDALSAAEASDIIERRDQLEKTAEPVADDVRRQFSLRTQNEMPAQRQMARAREELGAARAANDRGNGPVIGLVIVVLAGLAATAWWLFR